MQLPHKPYMGTSPALEELRPLSVRKKQSRHERSTLVHIHRQLSTHFEPLRKIALGSFLRGTILDKLRAAHSNANVTKLLARQISTHKFELCLRPAAR